MKKVLGLFSLILGYLALEWLLNHEVLLLSACATISVVLYIKYGKKVNNKLRGVFAFISKYVRGVFLFIKSIFRFLIKTINLIYTLGFIYISIKKMGLGISYIEAIKTASIIGNKITINHKGVNVTFKYVNKINKMINRINRKVLIRLLKPIRSINNSFSAIKPLMQQL